MRPRRAACPARGMQCEKARIGVDDMPALRNSCAAHFEILRCAHAQLGSSSPSVRRRPPPQAECPFRAPADSPRCGTPTDYGCVEFMDEFAGDFAGVQLVQLQRVCSEGSTAAGIHTHRCIDRRSGSASASTTSLGASRPRRPARNATTYAAARGDSCADRPTMSYSIQASRSTRRSQPLDRTGGGDQRRKQRIERHRRFRTPSPHAADTRSGWVACDPACASQPQVEPSASAPTASGAALSPKAGPGLRRFRGYGGFAGVRCVHGFGGLAAEAAPARKADALSTGVTRLISSSVVSPTWPRSAPPRAARRSRSREPRP